MQTAVSRLSAPWGWHAPAEPWAVGIFLELDAIRRELARIDPAALFRPDTLPNLACCAVRRSIQIVQLALPTGGKWPAKAAPKACKALQGMALQEALQACYLRWESIYWTLMDRGSPPL